MSLPTIARDLARPAWLPADLATAAPLVGYLVAIALITPSTLCLVTPEHKRATPLMQRTAALLMRLARAT